MGANSKRIKHGTTGGINQTHPKRYPQGQQSNTPKLYHRGQHQRHHLGSTKHIRMVSTTPTPKWVPGVVGACAHIMRSYSVYTNNLNQSVTDGYSA